MNNETLQILIDNLFSILALLLMAIAFMVVFFGGIVIVFKRLKVKSASIKTGVVEFDVDGKPIPVVPVIKPTPHSQCIHGKDIVLMLANQEDMFNNITKIKENILPEQMKLAEATIAFIEMILLDAFVCLLSKWVLPPESILEHKDYAEFQLCLDKMTGDLRKLFRIHFRANGFAEKEEKQFRQYISDVIAEIHKEKSKLFCRYYRGAVVKRELVNSETDKLNDTISIRLTSLLCDVRDISIKAKEDIFDARKEFTKYFNSIF